ncbi:flagellar basal body rod protein FlgC [Defluviimonas sp. WL0002]|uniref:Flagellar basal body rod protein FlgC n=1 Tax=Albidovulum marisflavi TaxID=2984159 RepID=A0ABT2Z7E2_9RHOB|nr:flagellar basal body rod protein FlgC [Defluviimonas sp. WL0002]MCV2867053.1 flagellar basal body rod protein FlgC [Defluviimonas sp. WL0002]
MSDLSLGFSIAASGLRAQAMRLRHVSENVANIDTPGFRRKLTTFEPASSDGGPSVQLGPERLDPSELPRIFSPGHPMADDQGYYDGSNVNLIVELADAREAQRSYEANLRMFDQSRQMARNLIELLKR